MLVVVPLRPTHIFLRGQLNKRFTRGAAVGSKCEANAFLTIDHLRVVEKIEDITGRGRVRQAT